ncbi:MAG: hypothetical protein A2Y03_10195 [Omnitrophica WOR_2 bacterium GWF2_38_59]|nr:MAG: hypothetical protein A2Y03_10195 [Omnitrophica WOR_2 bacterium GWF2_38_59]
MSNLDNPKFIQFIQNQFSIQKIFKMSEILGRHITPDEVQRMFELTCEGKIKGEDSPEVILKHMHQYRKWNTCALKDKQTRKR